MQAKHLIGLLKYGLFPHVSEAAKWSSWFWNKKSWYFWSFLKLWSSFLSCSKNLGQIQLVILRQLVQLLRVWIARINQMGLWDIVTGFWVFSLWWGVCVLCVGVYCGLLFVNKWSKLKTLNKQTNKQTATHNNPPPTLTPTPPQAKHLKSPMPWNRFRCPRDPSG